MISDNGGPAFPWGENGTHLGGISMRDYFAAKAMQALTPICWDHVIDYENASALIKCLAESAYEQADAMLAERSK